LREEDWGEKQQLPLKRPHTKPQLLNYCWAIRTMKARILMIAFSSIFALLGCAKKQLAIDATVIDLPDSAEVASTAFTAITDGCSKGQSYHTYIASLPKPWRTIYTAFSLDGEVNNGGFHQFFWNTDGKWNKETEEDLSAIGADPFLKLFREARKIFEAHDYAGEKAKSGNSWEGFTPAYKEKRMGELDSLYYKEKKSLPTFVGEYVKRNRALYERK
jgi:hypothetical protein